MDIKKYFKGLNPFSTDYGKERWNEDYKKNVWQVTRDISSLSHYSIAAGYVTFLKPNGCILDVGCGDGVLAERLSSSVYDQFIGIDSSEESIELAQKYKDKKTSFSVSDMNQYTTDLKFDAILFIESLYYFEDLLVSLKRYESFLSNDGIFIVAMLNQKESLQKWRDLHIRYPVIDETTVINMYGVTRLCKVFAVSSVAKNNFHIA